MPCSTVITVEVVGFIGWNHLWEEVADDMNLKSEHSFSSKCILHEYSEDFGAIEISKLLICIIEYLIVYLEATIICRYIFLRIERTKFCDYLRGIGTGSTISNAPYCPITNVCEY